MVERTRTSQWSGFQEDLVRFVLAGTSNMCSASVTNPIDVVKIRMQLDNELASRSDSKNVFKNRYYKGFIKGGSVIVRDEGIRGLYKGLLPSLMREGSYSTIRLGAYEPLKRLFGAEDVRHTPLWKKICSGAISGAIGSAIATPTDLIKVRMQACRHKLGEVPRYRSTFAAFGEVARTEGIRGLWTGVGPTVKRATILTATQIPVYDHAKHTLLNYQVLSEGIPLHITSSMIAGFMTAVTTSPVDVIKTRIMNQKKSGPPLYRSSWHCLTETVKVEGPLGLYKGFIPNWMRIGPHTIITFFIFEQLRKAVGMRPV